ncbi:hypothetical protein [Cupriavidus sp. UYPR2.512]|uniref:hypothetical protein n=1 Tax=Cupriavidus sp. UYPR2.512 TaxID=1080187 RepID=UPI000365052A|nr:hypothetical protein [Cupriavidus sp. UYPR2.512]UIF90930.1 hypothetical protein KAF44_32620 [Cupriavidus necator]
MNYVNAATKVPQTTDARDAEIPARISEAYDEVSFLHGTIDMLVGRLDAVLQPPKESPDVAATAAPSLTPLGEQLLTIGNRTRDARERLQDVLNRLEV